MMSDNVDRFDCEALLKLTSATVGEAKRKSLVDDDELTLSWTVPYGAAEECRVWLYANRVTLTNFDTPVKHYTGTYRTVSITAAPVVDRKSGETTGAEIVQEFAKGYYTEIDWDSARLVNDKKSIDDGDIDRHYLVKFPYCAPGSARAMAESLSASTYTDPSIGGVAHAGTFYNVYVGRQPEEDGSVTIFLFLADDQFSLTSFAGLLTPEIYDVYYVWRCPKVIAQDTIDAWRTTATSGSWCTAGYSEDQTLVDLVFHNRSDEEFEGPDDIVVDDDCRSQTVATYYIGVTTANIPAIPSVTDMGGITYRLRLDLNNHTGLWTAILYTQTAKYRNIENLTVEQSADRTVTQQQQLGLTDQGAASMDEQDGVIKTQRTEVRDDCSKDVTTNTNTGKAQISTERVAAPGFSETTTEKTYQSAGEAAPTAATGHVKSVRNAESKYPGKYDTVSKDRQYVDQPTSGVHLSAAATSSITEHSHKAAQESTAAVAGKIVRVENNPTEAGTFKTRREEISPVNQVGSGKDMSAAATNTITTETQAASAQPETPVAGQVVRVMNEPTEFGKYKTRKEVIEPTDQKNTDQEETHAQSAVVTKHTHNTAEETATQKDDTIVRVTNEPTEFGTHKTRREEITPKIQTGEASGGGAVYDETVTVHKNADSEITDGAGHTGTIIEGRSVPNDFGRFDNTKTVRSAKPLPEVTDSHGNAMVNKEVAVAENQTAIPNDGPGAAGTDVDVSFRYNQFGLFDYAKTTRTAQPFSETVSSGGNAEHSEITKIERHKSSVSEAVQSGVDKSVQVSVDEYGLLSANVVTQTPTYLHDSGSYATNDGTVFWWWGINASTEEYDAVITTAALDASTSNSVTKRKNKYGLIDYSVVKQPVGGSGGVLTPIDKSSIDTGWIFCDEETQTIDSISRTFRRVRVQAIVTNSESRAQDFLAGDYDGSLTAPDAMAPVGTIIKRLAGEVSGIEHSISGGWKRAVRVLGAVG